MSTEPGRKKKAGIDAGHTVAEENIGKLETGSKGLVFDFSDAAGNCDPSQNRTILKGVAADVGDGRGNGDAPQGGRVEESIGKNASRRCR